MQAERSSVCTGMWRTDVEVSLVDDSIKAERVGEVILFFGNRNRAHDFLYEQQLLGYIENQTLTCLHTAFSRDQVLLMSVVGVHPAVCVSTCMGLRALCADVTISKCAVTDVPLLWVRPILGAVVLFLRAMCCVVVDSQHPFSRPVSPSTQCMCVCLLCAYRRRKCMCSIACESSAQNWCT
jgi:hypothetical protein